MKKVRVTILGAGGMAGAHATRFKGNKDVEIVGVCDVSADIVDKFIDRNLSGYEPRPKTYTDAAKMYKELKPDAVAIVTPHTLHFEHGMQALDAGLHVLMEKPMVTSAEQAYKLAEKVKQSKKVFTIGYNTPCTPEMNYVRDTIRNGNLGKLEMVCGFLSQDWLRLTTGMWRQKPELSGGGQAYDSGAHLLNTLCWSVESNVAEVFAFVDNHGTQVDINSAITVKFENGVIAAIAISGNCPGGGSFTTFIFDNGKIEVDGWGGSWIKVQKAGQDIRYPQIKGESQSPNDNFIDAILGRGEPKTSPQNGIVQSELMDAIYESAKTGKPARPKRK